MNALKIEFTKMVASGNDFVIAEIKNQKSKIKNLNTFAKEICDRKFGVGADGLLVLEKSKIADIRMRIFNADGSEAEMCGNGARCVSLWQIANRKSQIAKIKIETRAGIIEAKLDKDSVRIKLTNPSHIKLAIPIKVNKRTLHVNFINTGVPHTVIFVEGLPRSFFLHSVSSKQKERGLDKIDVVNLGRLVRYHKRFAPAGSNVDFVEVLSNNSIKIRTYERGVEDETLACGTGAVASALLTAYSLQLIANKINVHTKSGEVLKVYFDKIDGGFRNVWLEGKAKIVYKGVYESGSLQLSTS